MNTYTQDVFKETNTFQKYERKRPSKHTELRSSDTSLDEHSERHNKGNCVKQAWRGIRDLKRNWSTEQ